MILRAVSKFSADRNMVYLIRCLFLVSRNPSELMVGATVEKCSTNDYRSKALSHRFSRNACWLWALALFPNFYFLLNFAI